MGSTRTPTQAALLQGPCFSYYVRLFLSQDAYNTGNAALLRGDTRWNVVLPLRPTSLRSVSLYPSLASLCRPLPPTIPHCVSLTPSTVSVPLTFLQSQPFTSSCLPLYFPPSNFPGMGFSAVILPASLLYVSVNISFSHCLYPSQYPPAFSFLLCHASLLSPSPVHLVAPFITSGHHQERLCVSAPPPLPSPRLSAVGRNQVQSKPCSSPKNSHKLRTHGGRRQNSSVFRETSRSRGTK